MEKFRGSMSSDVAGSVADSLPALLLIHGDSYSWGAGNSFDGTALAAHGRLIVVSINFRLGVFGKLSKSNLRTLISRDKRKRSQLSHSFGDRFESVIPSIFRKESSSNLD